jgi:hypothetical protein
MTLMYAVAAMLLASFAVGCIGAHMGLPTWLTAILGGAASILAIGVVQHL